MCAGAGHQLQVPGLGELPESRDQSSLAPLHEGPARVLEDVPVHRGEEVDIVPLPRPLDLAFRQLDQRVEVPHAPLAEERVFHHVRQRRRDRECQLERRALGPQAVEELDQRHIRFRDRLEEPALLQEAVELGVPDVRQVGVEDQQKISAWHVCSVCGEEKAVRSPGLGV